MSLSVKDIFLLRKEGHIEEAYAAILPLYAVHHGKYTTLCMFWCAVDMLKLRLQQVTDASSASCAAFQEAERIYLALDRLYPSVHAYEQYEALSPSSSSSSSSLSSSPARAMLENLLPILDSKRLIVHPVEE